MKALLFFFYFIAISDAIYTTIVKFDMKTPPQHQTVQMAFSEALNYGLVR